MDNSTIRIAISGASGRMGRKLIQAAYQSNKIVLGAALTSINSKLCGIDVGELIGLGNVGVIIKDNIVSVRENFDTLIDFSKPEATMKYLDFCCCHNKNMVIGTTGFTEKQMSIIGEASKDIGIVLSSNFSVEINVMLKLLEKAARVLGDFVDIEIIEAHHRYKTDAPSGTALAMGHVIASALGRNFLSCKVLNRAEVAGIRKSHSIGISTLRAGDIVGEHTALFVNIGERLEITHKAYNRMIFATGAIRAAIWLDKKSVGLFSMNNVLELDAL